MQIQSFPDRDAYLDLATEANVIPVCHQILADRETPVSLMERFAKAGQPFFLLESMEGGERWGRYSFLGSKAFALVRIFVDRVEFERGGEIEAVSHGGDPLGVLREILAEYIPADMGEALPRFWGGLVGYFTYEMASFFEPRVPNRLPDETPLASFMLPEELLIIDNQMHTLTCVVLTYLDDDADAGAAFEAARTRVEALAYEIDHTPHQRSITAAGLRDFSLACLTADDAFCKKVEAVKEHIFAGDIIQAVISQRFVGPAPEDMTSFYRALRYINPSPYLFHIQLDAMTIVGSSPETMVRVENGTACVRPIAGTRPRGETQQEDQDLAVELLADEKERAEHLMLVDLGRNDLGRVAQTGTVEVTDLMNIERYSHVMHIVSNVTCDLQPGKDALDVLAATFPAGTLSGAPKVRAMEIIAEQEDHPRGVYGGCAGYISFDGNLDMAITIRTAVAEAGSIVVQAGAGIVADSVPASEHQETINKAMGLSRALKFIEQI